MLTSKQFAVVTLPRGSFYDTFEHAAEQAKAVLARQSMSTLYIVEIVAEVGPAITVVPRYVDLAPRWLDRLWRWGSIR